MTKTEFGEQFKRMRLAGYRLPVFDGVTIKDVIDEWYSTFSGCTADEFTQALERLKQQKTDTWWPATGEIWACVFEVRKARAIRQQSSRPEYGEWSMPEADRVAFLSELRAAKDRILSKMGMAPASPQVAPDEESA